MTDILITGGVGLVSTIVSGWTSWILARRKYNSEVDSNIIANMQKTFDFYKDISNDNKNRLEEVLQENSDLRDEVENLSQENRYLRREIGNLKDQVIKIATTICTDLSCQIRSKDYSTLDLLKNEETKRS